MSGIDFDAAIRWSRFDPGVLLRRRSDDVLPFIDVESSVGRGVLLDTCFYIDRIHGQIPTGIATLLRRELVSHSTVAVQELMVGLGSLDPRHRGTSVAIADIREALRTMPGHRLHTPDADLLSRAALLCGILSRLQGYARDQRLRLLQDCVLFLQAQKLGLSVLTRNVRDFDFLLQLFPRARVLFYRI